MKQPDSNPLRKELARSQQAGPHPDSDMLTAFAESSLLVRERESVLEHLARCAQCREELRIAADASPVLVAEVQMPLLPRPTRPGLRSWLPWVAAAAGVLIVSSALLLREQWKPVNEALSGGSNSVATKEVAQAPAQRSQLPPPPEPKAATAPRKPTIPVTHGETAPRDEDHWTAGPASADTGTPAPLQGPNVQAVPPQSEVANSHDPRVIGSIGSSAKRPDSSGYRAEWPSAVSKQKQANPDQMARAKAVPAMSPVVGVQEAVAAESSPTFADAASAPTIRKADNAETARRHWRINELGQLERSFADGAWQSVPTHGTSKLRVVSVSGSEVWAGGENLRLEHSGDDGTTWESTKLPAKNGYNHAVTHIRFQTPQEGTIDSDDGTSWKTIDGGRTWK